MPIDWSSVPEPEVVGGELYELMNDLFLVPRSLTGDGVRATLAAVGRALPMDVVELPTGTRVFDWVLPREWNVHEAWIEGPDGIRVADFAESPLHLLGYSVPVDEVLDREELREHLFTDPRDPGVVPYRTSYWNEQWGFCLSQRTVDALQPGMYHVRIDSTLLDGSVTYGEVRLGGDSEDVFLITTTVCHPSLANDNLSGIVLLAGLARVLREQELRHSFRLVWSPGTIGPLCWLHKNTDVVPRVRDGFAVSCVGDPGPLTYKRSRRGDASVDKAATMILRNEPGATVLDWSPYGGDERQFCSPGFDLPFGALSRTPADAFPQYHSSADNLDLVRPESLGDSLHAALAIIEALERDETYVNTQPYGEPQLGRRGLYRGIGGGSSDEMALLWVLSLSDGTRSLLDIADTSGMRFHDIRVAADRLVEHDLLAALGREA